MVAVALVAGACGGGDDGDVEAYCALVRDDGLGLASATAPAPASDFVTLLEVAPADIRPTVEQLANTASDLTEITELDQLFAAAFDPDAQAARTAFDDYAVEACGVDLAQIASAEPDEDAAVEAEIAEYIATNFDGVSWASKVRSEVQRVDGDVHGLAIDFVIDAEDDEALAACRALSVWLYEVRGAAGPVNVASADILVAQRLGPAEACTEVG